jgi:hypothetical protein
VANAGRTFSVTGGITVVVKELEIPRAFHPISPAPVVKQNENPSFSTPHPMNRDNFTVLFIVACPLATQHRVVLANMAGDWYRREGKMKDERLQGKERAAGTRHFVMRTTNSIGTNPPARKPSTTTAFKKFL